MPHATKENWNLLSKYFDTYQGGNEVASGAVDNVFIAWPPIINFIDSYFPKKKVLKALDFGCGTGSFCNKLFSLGFDVTGVDLAEKMIEVARKKSNPKIRFIVGDKKNIPQIKFDLITSIMVFQFIEDIENTFKSLVSKLAKNGLLVFAVHSPHYVTNCLKAKVLFENFDSGIHPRRGYINFGDGAKVSIFIRTAAEYNQMFSKLGLKNIYKEYPPFTPEFLAKYPKNTPTDQPEYMILGYKMSKRKL